MHRDGFVWLGRLSTLKVENQLLLVYGYGERPVNHTLALEVEPFVINYTAKIRGKNSKDSKWKAIEYNGGRLEPPEFENDFDRNTFKNSSLPQRLPPSRPNMTAIRNGESSAKIRCKSVSPSFYGIILNGVSLGV